MSARRRPVAQGFTLLEVLIALAILGTAIVAAIQGFAQGLRLLKLAGDHQEAVLLADQVVREVVSDLEEGQKEDTVGRFTWVRTTRLVETPDLTPANARRRGKVYEIAVTVRWDQSRQVEIATLRTVSMPVEAEEAGRPPGRSREGSLSSGASSSSPSLSSPTSRSTSTSGSGSSSTSSSSSRSSVIRGLPGSSSRDSGARDSSR